MIFLTFEACFQCGGKLEGIKASARRFLKTDIKSLGYSVAGCSLVLWKER